MVRNVPIKMVSFIENTFHDYRNNYLNFTIKSFMNRWGGVYMDLNFIVLVKISLLLKLL